MPVNKQAYTQLIDELGSQVVLVAVSKTKPVADIRELYELGQRDFGENYVQELQEKQLALPPDIRWHFIGHLQSNKIKNIASYVSLIHGVDSIRLLQEINKQAKKLNRVIAVLLQVHIAAEETKFGFAAGELDQLMADQPALTNLSNIRIEGLMGMASFTEDEQQVAKEFHALKLLYDKYAASHQFRWLSMGMSSDYTIALPCGSNMVRIGSLLFGKRD